MAAKGGRLPSNGVLLEQLRNGTAQFELLPSPVPMPASDVRFFARTASTLGRGVSPATLDSRGGGVSRATKKVESYEVIKITGDGRCMFRALAKGMANHKGLALSSRQEEEDADELRMAVKKIICSSETEWHKYEEAFKAITVDVSLTQYCQRIRESDFLGGKSELMVLSKLYQQPIIVYKPEHEHTHGGRGGGFIPIEEYGSEFSKKLWIRKQREPIRLLFSGGNHYDLLV
ncbi:OVARIAN TUMOR DOMAIN-containing deubiquitinating enzyme 3-like [Curcuma longa]|uniref:OVARIAN TUMOR DOMAIN-containing deubiquitinating enzyme 3-like n=1 Tax=Curcuma longa TaxID=136217 RepID=UPI003D9F7C6A